MLKQRIGVLSVQWFSNQYGRDQKNTNQKLRGANAPFIPEVDFHYSNVHLAWEKGQQGRQITQRARADANLSKEQRCYRQSFNHCALFRSK